MQRARLRGGVTVFVAAVCAAAAVVAAPRNESRADGPGRWDRPLIEAAALARELPRVLPGAAAQSILPGGTVFPQSVASGDPRPDSVILWTRVDDAGAGEVDLPVRVIVTKDRFFHQVVVNRLVTARAADDHCVKVRVTGLEPGMDYIYLFVYYRGSDILLSRPGMTRTAPAPGSDVDVRFAFFNCQDYTNRYYNAIAEALSEHPNDLDFVVHLGDYVYETASKVPTPDDDPQRWFTFADAAGAIVTTPGPNPTLAAASLANYRQLYQVYRSDPMLQWLHERYPMIAIWDDHEYSDNCWGDTATYTSGRRDEANPTRRHDAERAYFEYMPIDWGLDEDGLLEIGAGDLWPDARIYRDFTFGANLHLVMTDYRSFRPDHLIAEDAFPGEIVMDRAVLESILGPTTYAGLATSLDPYVDLGTLPVLQTSVVAILSQAYLTANPYLTPAEAAGLAAQHAAGNTSATFLNGLFVAAGVDPPFDAAALAAMDRGLSYLFMGKQSLYSQLGSNYFVVKDTFELYAKYRALTSGGAAQDAYGQAQSAWLAATLAGSSATWQVLGSSVSMAPLILDFTNPVIAAMLPPTFPDVLRTRMLVNVDQWDGFPDARAQIVSLLQATGNAVIVSGDIHASFVTDHHGGLYEFTGTAVSSATWQEEVARVAASDPLLSSVPGLEQLIAQMGALFQISASDPTVSPAALLDTQTGANGFVVVTAGADSFRARYHHIGSEHVATRYYEDAAARHALFTTTDWVIAEGQISQP